MQSRTMEIIVTCDEGYLGPLGTMLVSLRENNAHERIRLWLLHRGIPPTRLAELEGFARLIDMELRHRQVDQRLFDRVRSSERYPQEMYYRLLAPHIIDDSVNRALYLDPDTLVINPLSPLYDIELDGCAFAAASHLDAAHPATVLNHVRLKTDTAYYNTGVVLMDMRAARTLIEPESLFAFAHGTGQSFPFPDQDVFNALYSGSTLEVPDQLWNYDARKYADNVIRTGGAATLDWVMANTAIIHFCGRDKPWNPRYRGHFASLYKHYAVRAARIRGDM